MPLLFARLPVRGDLDEVPFIYESLRRVAEMLGWQQGELFRVLTEILANTAGWFRAGRLSDDLCAGLVRLFLQSARLAELGGGLSGDHWLRSSEASTSRGATLP
jgi:hypothetical protein